MMNNLDLVKGDITHQKHKQNYMQKREYEKTLPKLTKNKNGI